jgi:hypothetical protein
VKTTVNFLFDNIDVAPHVIVFIGIYVPDRDQMLHSSTDSPCVE